MSQNEYFRVLSSDIQQALGKAAFLAYITFPPPFQFAGQWEELKPEMQERWLAIVESVMTQLQNMDEFVTTELMAWNERQRVLADAKQRFENWKADDDIHQNNYQRLNHLTSLFAEMINAQLLIDRKDFEQGNFQVTGVENTKKVDVPNVRRITE